MVIPGSIEWSRRPGKGLEDFGSFWASGDAANQGLDPFGVYPHTFRVGVAASPAPNLNPPISVYPMQLVALISPDRADQIWYVLSIAGYVAAVALLARAYRPANPFLLLWPFVLGGFWHTLELGQIYVPLLLATTGAWLLLRDRDDWRAGVLAGAVAAIKPQFIIWPLLLFLAGRRRSGATGVATAGALSLAPIVLNGTTIYHQWRAATPPILPPQVFPGNSSLLSMFGRLDHGWWGIGATAVMLAGCFAWTWWRKPPALTVSAIAIIAALLAGPISWPGYTILLLPIFFAVGWERTWPAAVILALPYWRVFEIINRGGEYWNFVGGSVYGFGIIALVVLLLAFSRRPALRGERESASREVTAVAV